MTFRLVVASVTVFVVLVALVLLATLPPRQCCSCRRRYATQVIRHTGRHICALCSTSIEPLPET